MQHMKWFLFFEKIQDKIGLIPDFPCGICIEFGLLDVSGLYYDWNEKKWIKLYLNCLLNNTFSILSCSNRVGWRRAALYRRGSYGHSEPPVHRRRVHPHDVPAGQGHGKSNTASWTAAIFCHSSSIFFFAVGFCGPVQAGGRGHVSSTWQSGLFSISVWTLETHRHQM